MIWRFFTSLIKLSTSSVTNNEQQLCRQPLLTLTCLTNIGDARLEMCSHLICTLFGRLWVKYLVHLLLFMPYMLTGCVFMLAIDNK